MKILSEKASNAMWCSLTSRTCSSGASRKTRRAQQQVPRQVERLARQLAHLPSHLVLASLCDMIEVRSTS